jgi:hypothetical protein
MLIYKALVKCRIIALLSYHSRDYATYLHVHITPTLKGCYHNMRWDTDSKNEVISVKVLEATI